MSEQQEFADFEIEHDFTANKEWDGEYQLVPPGEYTVDVTNLEQKPGKKAPMVAVTFQITEDHEGFAGQKLFGNYSLSDKAIGRLKQLMMACGASLDKFRASELLGSRIQVSVVHTLGEAQVDQDGQPQPARTFANVQNERAIEVKEAPKAAANKKAAAAAPTPPIANGKPTTQPRRT